MLRRLTLLAKISMKVKPRLGGRPGEPKRLEWVLERWGGPPGMAPALIVRLAAMVLIVVALVSLGTFDSVGGYLKGYWPLAENQSVQPVVSETAAVEEMPPPVEIEPLPAVPAPAATSPPVVKTGSESAAVVSVRPTAGKIIREYGLTYSQTFQDYRHHAGIDYAAAKGAPIRAAGAGRVAAVSENKDEGLVILLDHGAGWQSRYAGGSESKVKKGETVKAGQTIALVGSPGRLETAEGFHLHFELLKNGQKVNPGQYLP